MDTVVEGWLTAGPEAVHSTHHPQPAKATTRFTQTAVAARWDLVAAHTGECGWVETPLGTVRFAR